MGAMELLTGCRAADVVIYPMTAPQLLAEWSGVITIASTIDLTSRGKRDAAKMARCDVSSAQQSGISCSEFYRLQTSVAGQTKAFRASLRKLGGTLSRRGGMDTHDKQTIARFEKYMGRDAAKNYNRVAFANNILVNAERELRSTTAVALFDRKLGAGGKTRPGAMVFGDTLSTTTILHEAIHFGTAPWRSKGGAPLILDRGTIGSYRTYGTLRASLERARYGWDYASRSAASFAWLVTGP